MATTVRSRRFAASPERVWVLAADPHHLPRWWPGVVRVEDVGAQHFTQVLSTKQGRPVRMDQRVTESSAPHVRSWSQQLAGTPFERLLTGWTTTITIEPVPGGCTVTLAETQELRGSFKLGRPLQLRPARRRLDEALAALADLVES